MCVQTHGLCYSSNLCKFKQSVRRQPTNSNKFPLCTTGNLRNKKGISISLADTHVIDFITQLLIFALNVTGANYTRLSFLLFYINVLLNIFCPAWYLNIMHIFLYL